MRINTAKCLKPTAAATTFDDCFPGQPVLDRSFHPSVIQKRTFQDNWYSFDALLTPNHVKALID